MLVRGDKFLVLRYSNGMYNCIKNHRAVLEKNGYCWFGKIGVVPSERALGEKLNSDKPLVVLYCQGDAFVCSLIGVSTEKPSEGYPLYYNAFMYDRNIFPKMYFKLGSLEEIPKEIFAKCISLSSGRPLTETVSRSMASFFYGDYPVADNLVLLEYVPVKKEKKERKTRRKQSVIVDKNSCVYQVDGFCTNRRCINYKYECERPSSCMKQAPREVEGV